MWRFIVWVLVLGGALIAEGSYDDPVRRAVGAIPRDLVSLTLVTTFMWWSMHFLLAGRVRWRELVRPAIASGVLWVVFALVSSIYFSSALISENKLYGTIGVVFILVTWFIAIGAVIVLGVVCGECGRSERAERTPRRRPPLVTPTERRRGACAFQ